MNLKEIINLPKPYDISLSEKYSGVDVNYEGEYLFTLPFAVNRELREKILNELNIAFAMGCFHGETVANRTRTNIIKQGGKNGGI